MLFYDENQPFEVMAEAHSCSRARAGVTSPRRARSRGSGDVRRWQVIRLQADGPFAPDPRLSELYLAGVPHTLRLEPMVRGVAVVQGAGVVFALADVQTQEHRVLGAQALPHSGSRIRPGHRSGDGCRHPRYGETMTSSQKVALSL
jgi:hypothetical protein